MATASVQMCNQILPTAESNFMNPVELSETDDSRSEGDTQRNVPNGFEQAMPRRENVTSNKIIHSIKDFCGIGIGGKRVGKVEQVPCGLNDKGFETSPIENCQAESFPKLVAHLSHQKMLGDSMGTKDPSLHEDQRRAQELSNLGEYAYRQFICRGDVKDIDQAIKYWRESATLLGNSQMELRGMLTNLASAYGSRFERLGETSDLHSAIGFGEEAVSLSPDDHHDKSAYLSNLSNLYAGRFEHLSDLPDLNKAIEFGEDAVSLAPNDHPAKPTFLNNLGASYRTRFECLGELSDLSKAIEFDSQAVSLTPDGHPDKPMFLSGLGVSYQTRFERLGELSELNRAIGLNAKAVSLAPEDHPEKPMYLSSLATSYKARFGRLPVGELSDLNEAIELDARAVSLTPDGHSNKPAYLNNLGVSYRIRSDRLRELSDLNQAIECQEQAVLLTPSDHSEKPECLSSLGISYSSRFELSGELPDLIKAIDLKTQAVSLTPTSHPDRPQRLIDLGNSYTARFRHSTEFSDLQSAERFFLEASRSTTGPPFVRHAACCEWAKLSSLDSRFSPLPAYQQAMALIPQLIWIGTTVGCRYELVARVSMFASEAASYAISTGACGLALEWLEAGRSIVWGQIAQLRRPFEKLSSHSPELAEELAAIGHRLEHAGSRAGSPSSPEADHWEVSQEANNHVNLALQWDQKLEEIRLIPEFKDFLRSPTAGQLMSAAKTHPIAIINLHKSRCDALIIQPGGTTISHVALTDFSSEDAISAHHDVFTYVRGRELVPPSKRQRPLQISLEKLWTGVIKPVLRHLGYTRKLPVDQLPHLTWCTTGILSFLPLQAARSPGESQTSTFDFVISSYTPTLSALLSSQSAISSSACGILAVGQESTPGLISLPYTTKELAVIHKHAQFDCYLQLENDEATVEQVLDAMDQFSWVHMACHGSQNAGDPTKSAFHLHDDNLTLATITRRPFTNKGLAFLSACQTATGDKNMPDEAVHLAAGMLMAGYPSVIATMWSIADEDGPEVADLVYAELLKDGKMDHTKSARALHRAVARLREKVGEKNIARWAPFIHIGC